MTFKPLLSLFLFTVTFSLFGQDGAALRSCEDNCFRLPDGAEYWFEMRSNDTMTFEMLQQIQTSERGVTFTISNFSTTQQSYRIAENFYNELELQYELLTSGIDLNNKEAILVKLLDFAPAIEQDLDFEGHDLSQFRIFGQFAQFTSLIAQLHNVELPMVGKKVEWPGILHGEYYQINNFQIDCTFEFEYNSENNMSLAIKVNVDQLKSRLEGLGISTDTLVDDSTVVAISQVNRVGFLEGLVLNLPVLKQNANPIVLKYVVAEE